MRVQFPHSHDRSGAGQLTGADHLFGGFNVNRTMLLIDSDEVKAAQSDQFGQLGGGNIKETANYCVASLQFGFGLVGFQPVLLIRKPVSQKANILYEWAYRQES